MASRNSRSSKKRSSLWATITSVLILLGVVGFICVREASRMMWEQSQSRDELQQPDLPPPAGAHEELNRLFDEFGREIKRKPGNDPAPGQQKQAEKKQEQTDPLSDIDKRLEELRKRRDQRKDHGQLP